MKGLWGGRFEALPADSVRRLNDSFRFDWRLWQEDIEGSIAWASALEDAGVLNVDEASKIISALNCLTLESLSAEAEDVHDAVERALRERVGALAGKLHTGRSRNDQVATDTRLFVRRRISAFLDLIRDLQRTIIDIAEREFETVLPGLTHLQHAQPVLLAHHVLAYFWMLERDHERFTQVRNRVNVLPLGSGALAGTTAPIDRLKLAHRLGFDQVTENSMDAVADRDYLVEYLSCASILLMHLSRLAEEIILWNSPEFGFIELDDQVTTGSSMMPQKKNPDVAELARSKPGRVYGHLMSLLTVLKGLPLTYNKDLQEDKEGLFDTVDTLNDLLPAFTLMLQSAKFNAERMRSALRGDFSTATDLADVLVKSGMPFREAHELIGKIVKNCIERRIALEDLSPADLKSFAPSLVHVDCGWNAVLASMRARCVHGGTAPDSVRIQLGKARSAMAES